MPRTTDPVVHERLVRDLVTLYDKWPSQPVWLRRLLVETCLRDMASRAGLPGLRSVRWGTNGSEFDYESWSMELDDRALTFSPRDGDAGRGRSSLRAWLEGATSLVHELRHAEQHFMILQAFFAGHLVPPGAPTPAPVGGLSLPANAQMLGNFVKQTFGYPGFVLNKAYESRQRITEPEAKQAKPWLDSMYGSGSAHRTSVMQHLHWTGPMQSQYRGLPEEADAYALQRRVINRVRQSIVSAGYDSGLEGVRSLFGP